ncbi:MAG: CheR family methyltransferase [bacterium]
MQGVKKIKEKPAGALSDDEIKFISDFVYKRTGIVLGKNKRYLIEGRLHSVACICGISKLADINQLLADHNPQVETLVIDALTTHETSWFRDQKPFDALAKIILPAIAQQKKSRVLQVWSAACSTGQEPYSIAMLILESRLYSNGLVRIFATDISTQALEHAREGRYSQYQISRGLPVKYLIKYFEQEGHNWKIVPEVKKMVSFRKSSLQNAARELGVFDLVFCRNVLIYFDMLTKKKILSQISQVLAPHGLLALGGSETTLAMNTAFKRIRLAGATFFAKAESSDIWTKMKSK